MILFVFYDNIHQKMFPRIIHSRSQLQTTLYQYDNGATSLFVSSDTYPDIFDFLFPSIRSKTQKKWELKGKMRYLWFPPDALQAADIDSIKLWQNKYMQYVLIGKSDQIKDFFSDELDFCISLDFNFIVDPESGAIHTQIGEIEKEIKYDKIRTNFPQLLAEMNDLFNYLPINIIDKKLKRILVTFIPKQPKKNSLAQEITQNISKNSKLNILNSLLKCKKKEIKSLEIAEKISEWGRIYSDTSNIELSCDVKNKTIVIIDDLYQSGVSMWSYAKFLKQSGAKTIIGMTCVKSLRDKDNLK